MLSYRSRGLLQNAYGFVIIDRTCLLQIYTFPETNMAPENGWLEYYFPIGEAYFQGLC